MLMALVRHILCGISDCLLTYAPNGKADLTNFKDYNKSKIAFQGMSLKNLSIAMLLGVIAMTLEIFGYLAVCDFFKITCYTMYVGYAGILIVAVVFLIAVITGKTTLPVWTCIFNLLPLAIVIMPTKIPAKANVIGVIMFAGLIFLI